MRFPLMYMPCIHVGGNGEARIWEEEEANVLNNHLQQHQYTTTGIQHQSMLK